MEYIGEWTLPGNLGKLFIYLSFILAALAAWSYIQAPGFRDGSIQFKRPRMAGWLYSLHTLMLLMAAGMLMWLIVAHRFEYIYVWQHSSTELPWQYLFSSFWAGQEGSFMLWALFQALLGQVFMRSAGKWEAPAMAVYSVAQFLLISALLGLDIGIAEIGRSPFVLIRETVADISNSIFARPDYLTLLTEGNGMNPLLENIWMTTHPPALFLGYASALVPFCLAAAALIRRDTTTWIDFALPWVIFSILALGIGIILGGMWAYVSLTFGGFWAWDPVENASLVPWLALTVALHFLLVAKKRGQSKVLAFVTTFLGYILVIYASFLTRSGILGQSSVHAFGENGMLVQLLIMLAFFAVLPALLMHLNKTQLKSPAPSQPVGREFWMVAGGLVMLLSAFQITFVTSVPVWNSIFGLNLAPPADPVAYYNKWQMPFAFLFSIFMGASVLLDYKQSNMRAAYKSMGISALLAAVITLPLALILFSDRLVFAFFLFGSLFVLISSVFAGIRLLRKSINPAGMVTHLGFGLFLAGVVITFANSETISRNTTGMSLGNRQSNAENQVMFRGDTLPMGKYFASYTQRRETGKEVFYTIAFYKPGKDGRFETAFTVTPNINRNEKMGYVYNPSTHSLLTKDIYTYISFAEDHPGTLRLIDKSEIKTGDTIRLDAYFVRLDSLSIENNGPGIDPNNISIAGHFQVFSHHMKPLANITASYIIVQGTVNHRDGVFEPAGLNIIFEGVSDQPGHIFASITQNKPDFIVLKAVINPYINLVWAGALITFAGLAAAIVNRVKRRRKQNLLNSPINHQS
jgi:cytochrome c-type biogenesis protein CcmF